VFSLAPLRLDCWENTPQHLLNRGIHNSGCQTDVVTGYLIYFEVSSGRKNIVVSVRIVRGRKYGVNELTKV
jgi:hypothetical protein